MAEPVVNSPNLALCEICHNSVSLDTVITVCLVDADGSEVKQPMTEEAARTLIGELGLEQPPVLCDRHERLPDWLRSESDPLPAQEAGTL